ncbi:hypothetical protein [Mycolicibacterium sp. HK-90]|uniref:PPE domain-containing protein n=1 Tax=Mycolicibacterium sp. HK-90 TaxID=3056937 RepID=UPI002657B176|nr:hypothetical protein [Mycolicibacterium sp. HK-90]WKG03644.1 hypothetical protein QU592_00375 [Mycolicibacterium sp. HK-90]
MGDKVKATPSELKSTAEILLRPRPKGPDSDAGSFDGPFEPPDQLHSTVAACNRLDSSAHALAQAFAAGDCEAERLAAALKATAVAYEQLDEQNQAVLDRQMRGDNTSPPIKPIPPDLTTMPESFKVPLFDAQDTEIDEDYFLGWEDAVHAIYDHDPRALSLNYFRDRWKGYRTTLQIHAEKFVVVADWDGDAAAACRSAMGNLRDWWMNMADECLRLANEAQKVLDAHDKLVAEHPDENDVRYYNTLNRAQKMYKYPEYNGRSKTARDEYASKIGITASRPGGPPAISGVPAVNAGEVGSNPNAQPPGGPGSPGGPGGGPGGGGGGTPEMPEMPKTPEVPSMSPAGMDPAASGQPSGSPSGGSPSGGSPSGGSPGGGAPSGGSPSGAPTGMPEGPATDVPALDEPTLSPASAGGGGGAPGGGGGDIPKTPLAPAVGAENVAPTKGGPGIPAGAPGAPGAAGGMGGGMGGMGGGHGQGGQGNEKRRNPKLAPDEELYKEDRAWTEAVIGNRKRTDVKDTNK